MVQSPVITVSVVIIVLVFSVAVVYFSGAPYGPTGTGTTGRFTSTSIITSTSATSTTKVSVFRIQIPLHSGVPPPGFNVTNLLTGTFRYRFNFTVVVGVNNTIRWVNDDSIDHTVSSFVIPNGAEQFNSGLIPPGGKFSVVLVVPGEYRYTCIWHPFLAGEIRVMPASS